MRRLFVLLMLSLSLAATAQTYSVRYKNTPISQVIDDLRCRTGYEFVYQKQVIEGVAPVTCAYDDMPLEGLLDRIFYHMSELRYEIVEKSIILRLPAADDEMPTFKRTIVGFVGDEDGEPLIGARVTQEGTKHAVTTDVDGNFSILVEGRSPRLIVSLAGMKERVVSLSGLDDGMPVVVTLSENASVLDEVFITGYQNVKRENATGSYQLVSAKELEKRFTGDVTSNLEGKVPGLVLYNNGATDDGKAQLLIRGSGSFQAKTSPLVVVDNLPIEGGLESINPYDIENITILKDAAAAAIYGARASNGVIVITTKRAKSERLEVGFNADLVVSERPDYGYMHWANAQEMLELERLNFRYVRYSGNQSAMTSLKNDYKRNPGSLPYVLRLFMANYNGELSKDVLDAQLASLAKNDYRQDWRDAMERTHVRQQYNLSLRNRGKYLNSSIVVNYSGDNEGQYKEHDNALTFSYRGSVDATKWLNLEFGVNVINNRQQHHVASEWNGINSFQPYFSARNPDGSLAEMEAATYLQEPALLSNVFGFKPEGYNIFTERNMNFSNLRETNIRSFAHATAEVLEGWTVGGQFQYEDIYSKNQSHLEADSYDMRHLYNLYTTPDGKHHIPDGGMLKEREAEGAYYTFRAQTDFQREFAEKHSVEALVGFEYRQTRYKSLGHLFLGYDDQSQTNNMSLANFAGLTDLLNGTSALGVSYPMGGAPGGEDFRSSDVLHRYYSIYFNAGYTYNHRYSLTGSWRVDKTDLFGADPKFRGRPLWSVGAGWNVENESWAQDWKWLGALKLRASYGLTGNIDQSVSSYLTAAVEPNEMNGVRLAKLNTPPNEQLRWEKTASLNIGADFALWRGRLTGSLDWYRKAGSDLLTVTDIDPTTGWNSLTINNGKALNTGVELQLNGMLLRAKSARQLGISLSLGLAYNRNEVTEVNHEPASGSEALRSYTLHKGYPIHSLFSCRYAGITVVGGTPAFAWYDKDGAVHTAIIDTEEFSVGDIVYSGSLDPKVTLSLSPELTWRGLSLSAMLAYYGGHKMRARIEDWTTEGSQYGYQGLSYLEAVPSSYLNYWQQASDACSPNGYPGSLVMGETWQYIDANVVPADFLSLRNIVLGYEFDNKLCRKLGLGSLRVRAQINNVCKWMRNNLGVDPEANDPISGTTLMKTPRSYTFSLQITL